MKNFNIGCIHCSGRDIKNQEILNEQLHLLTITSLTLLCNRIAFKRVPSKVMCCTEVNHTHRVVDSPHKHAEQGFLGSKKA